MEGFTLELLQKKVLAGKIRGYNLAGTCTQGPAKKAKYRNEKIIIDGIKFQSKKEGARYLVLKMMETAGLIAGLQLQVPFELNKGGTHSLKYIADFTYYENSLQIVEDAKGYKTKLFKKKMKLMEKIYDIKIKLT